MSDQKIEAKLACAVCGGTGHVGSAYTLQTEGYARDRERLAAAESVRVQCWKCAGSGRKRHVDMTRDEIREKYQHDPNWPIQSFDAQDWAKAFIATFGAKLNWQLDEATMLGWFANALMRGWDQRQWEMDALNIQGAGATLKDFTATTSLSDASIAKVGDPLTTLRRLADGCSFPENDFQRLVRDICRAAIAKAES